MVDMMLVMRAISKLQGLLRKLLQRSPLGSCICSIAIERSWQAKAS